MSVQTLLALAFSLIVTENFVLVRCLGICPFLTETKKVSVAVGTGLAVTFIMGMGSALAWSVNTFVLSPLGLSYLQIVVYLLLLVLLVQAVEVFLRKALRALYALLRAYLPVVTANCAILGALILSTGEHLGFMMSAIYGILAGLGFTLASAVFAAVRERLEFSEPPKAFRGAPIALVTAALLAMVLMGFSGVKVW